MNTTQLDSTGNVVSSTSTGGTGGGTGGQGPQGNPGANGLSVLSGVGAPANSLGVDGQPGYVDTSNKVLYAAKASGVWPAGASFQGTAGANGTNGLGVLSGSGAPSNSLGVDGQPGYWDFTTPAVYGPKANGAWPAPVTLNTGSGLSFFQMDGQFWTSSSTTARYKWCIALHNTQGGQNDQLDMAFVMPYAGTLRQIIVVQNGGTTQTGNVFIQRAPMVATGTPLTFSDIISLPNFIQVVNGYQTCRQTYTQVGGVALAAGDTIKADIQYNGGGVNQSSIIELIFACPGVT